MELSQTLANQDLDEELKDLDGLGTTNFRLDSGRLTDSLRGLRGKDKETRKGFTIVLRSLFSEVSLDEPGKFVKVSRLSCKR